MHRTLAIALLLVACHAPATRHAPVPRPSLQAALEALQVLDFPGALGIAASLDATDGAYVRLLVASRTHDREALLRHVASSDAARLRAHPRRRALLAEALRWTVGLREAREDLEATCRAPVAETNADTQATDCTLAAFAASLGDAPVLQRPPGTAADVEILRGPPIVVVRASVNGMPPAPFIVDTGASSTVLSRAWTERAGLAFDSTHAIVTHDASATEVRLFPVLLASLGVGALQVDRVPVAVLALPPQIQVAGILAPHDTFRGLTVEIDLRAYRLRLHPTPDAGLVARSLGEPVEGVDLWWDDGNIYVPARINAASTWLMLDTGAAHSFVRRPFAMQLGWGERLARQATVSGISAGGSHPVQAGSDAMLSIGREPAAREHLIVLEAYRIPDWRPAVFEQTGNLGFPWMRGRRLFLSGDGRRCWFTAGVVTPPPAA